MEAIERLPLPVSLKGVQRFPEYVGFYYRFIKDFSKITSPLCRLLAKDVPLNINDDCLKVFEE